MEPLFRKCLLALEKITEHSLPIMEMAYKNYLDEIKNKTINSECLNHSKAVIVSAQEALKVGMIDNKNVKKYLEQLDSMDGTIKARSKDLNEKLDDNRSKFIRYSKDVSEKNRDLLNTLKEGEVPAEDLLRDIISLGKKIQKITNEDIMNYRQIITSFVKKIENEICNEVYTLHNKIQSLDAGTLPMVKTREWTYVEPFIFHRRGAFVNTEYDAQ